MLRTALLLAAFCAVPSFADTISWYNGDNDGFNILLNEDAGGGGNAFVYDDFNVGSPISVTGVFSNDVLTAAGVTEAYWEIRSGVSAGSGGTLIASGTDAATQTDLGITSFGDEVYDIEVTGLDVNLAAGTYWLTVAPVMPDTKVSYVVTTSGTNGVGSPQAQDGDSFLNSVNFGTTFEAASDFTGTDSADGNNVDFSEGVIAASSGTVPEPSSAALFGGLALLGSFFAMKRRRLTRS